MTTEYRFAQGEQAEWVPRGEKHYMSKLTERIIQEIRARHESGERMRKIAKSLGVTVGTISSVVHRRTWTHV